MTKELLKGNIAIAKGALACGCSCYFGYPITPQTEIGEYLSSEMPKRELAYVCAESELAAINMALGATATGAKALVTSSSCAVALMKNISDKNKTKHNFFIIFSKDLRFIYIFIIRYFYDFCKPIKKNLSQQFY